MARGHIQVNEDRCKGCELCISVCPYHLIAKGEHFNSKGYQPVEFNNLDDKCTGCTLCAMICPDAAIIVYREIKKAPPHLSQAII